MQEGDALHTFPFSLHGYMLSKYDSTVMLHRLFRLKINIQVFVLIPFLPRKWNRKGV
jgi:hypothetical protein